jgi:cellulose synthase/poly-beta-1,6-N-acetylglucosamine synthase-like glycosyltransferase
VVSVDSDVILEKNAIRLLVSRFVDETVGAVGGRVRVQNPSENWLTRMQTIKYHYSYELFKNVERAFYSVLCLSGCLTAYRRHVMIELEPVLENRSVLGVPIKYGEDRYLTRQIVKAGYKTFLTLQAACWTVVPNTLTKFWSQQLRWRRSVIIDSFGGMSHVWKLHPFVTLQYVAIFAMEIGYPVAIAVELATGMFLSLAAFHVAVLAVLGAWYWLDTRDLPAGQRVHPASLLPMAAIMPVIYLLLTPLALFTLDSSSWETRGHQATVRP